MFNVFRQMIQKEKPDYVLEMKTSTCRQLEASCCKFAKNQRFYVAMTFYTDTWISPNPLGPLAGGATTISCLEDVATVSEFSSKSLCLNYPAVSSQDLQEYLNHANRQFSSQVAGLIEPQGNDEFSYKLLVAPVPAFVVKIVNNASLVGTILVNTDGGALPVAMCHPRVAEYAEQLSHTLTFTRDALLLGQQSSTSIHKLQLEGGE